MNLDPRLLEILACPNCHGPLRVDDPAGELLCTGTCRFAYPVRDDIPVLLIDEARRPEPGSPAPSTPAPTAPAQTGPAPTGPAPTGPEA